MHGVTLEEEVQKLRLLQADAGHRNGADKNRRNENTKKRGRGNRRREKRGATILKIIRRGVRVNKRICAKLCDICISQTQFGHSLGAFFSLGTLCPN